MGCRILVCPEHERAPAVQPHCHVIDEVLLGEGKRLGLVVAETLLAQLALVRGTGDSQLEQGDLPRWPVARRRNLDVVGQLLAETAEQPLLLGLITARAVPVHGVVVQLTGDAKPPVQFIEVVAEVAPVLPERSRVLVATQFHVVAPGSSPGRSSGRLPSER